MGILGITAKGGKIAASGTAGDVAKALDVKKANKVNKHLEAGTSVSNLLKLGILKPDAAMNPSAVKSAATKYKKLFEGNPAFRRKETAVQKNPQQVTDTDIGQRKIIMPEDIMGQTIVPVVGDRSTTGRIIESAGGVKFDEPVRVEGGAGFPQERQGTGLGWASMEDAAKKKQANFDLAARETDENVIGVYSAMGDRAIDFSTPIAEAMMKKTLGTNIPKPVKASFDKELRKVFKDWKGIDSPDAMDQLMGRGDFPMKGAGAKRVLFTDLMSKAKWRDQGFPSYTEIVDLATEDALKSVGVGDAGFSMFQAKPDAKTIPFSTHQSYDTGIAGEYIGGLAKSIPPEIMFPKIWRHLSEQTTAAGKPFARAQKTGSFMMNPKLFEKADQEWLDGVSKYLQDAAQEGRKLPDGQGGFVDPKMAIGLIAVGGLGTVAAEKAQAGIVPEILQQSIKIADDLESITAGKGGTFDTTKDVSFIDKSINASNPRANAEALIYDQLRTQKEKFGEKVFDSVTEEGAEGVESASRNRLRLPEEYQEQLQRLGISTPDLIEHPSTADSAKDFFDRISKAKDENKYGAAVYVYPEAEYQDMRLFTTEDGTAGYALKPDGDLVSAFSTGKHKGIAPHLLLSGIEEGATKLDAFDTVLPDLYSRLGFREGGRLRWDDSQAPDDWDKTLFGGFNEGEPDVSFMGYSADPSIPVQERYVDDYSQALEGQQSAIKPAIAGAAALGAGTASAQDGSMDILEQLKANDPKEAARRNELQISREMDLLQRRANRGGRDAQLAQSQLDKMSEKNMLEKFLDSASPAIENSLAVIEPAMMIGGELGKESLSGLGAIGTGFMHNLADSLERQDLDVLAQYARPDESPQDTLNRLRKDIPSYEIKSKGGQRGMESFGKFINETTDYWMSGESGEKITSVVEGFEEGQDQINTTLAPIVGKKPAAAAATAPRVLLELF